MKASQDVPHRMRCCRKVCGRHLISLVNSNSEVSCHKCDPGGLEADICGSRQQSAPHFYDANHPASAKGHCSDSINIPAANWASL